MRFFVFSLFIGLFNSSYAAAAETQAQTELRWQKALSRQTLEALVKTFQDVVNLDQKIAPSEENLDSLIQIQNDGRIEVKNTDGSAFASFLLDEKMAGEDNKDDFSYNPENKDHPWQGLRIFIHSRNHPRIDEVNLSNKVAEKIQAQALKKGALVIRYLSVMAASAVEEEKKYRSHIFLSLDFRRHSSSLFKIEIPGCAARQEITERRHVERLLQMLHAYPTSLGFAVALHQISSLPAEGAHGVEGITERAVGEKGKGIWARNLATSQIPAPININDLRIVKIQPDIETHAQLIVDQYIAALTRYLETKNSAGVYPTLHRPSDL